MRHLLAPDLSAPTGGNRYDAELLARGVVDRVVGSLGEVPDGACVLLDGLVASAHPDLLAAHSGRVRLVLLVHLLRADDVPPNPSGGGGAVAALVDAVVVPSRFAARRVLEVSGVRAVVAEPGTAPARPSVARGRTACCRGDRSGGARGSCWSPRPWRGSGTRGRCGAPGRSRRVSPAGHDVAGTAGRRCAAGGVGPGRPARPALGVRTVRMAVAEGLARGVPSLVADRGELPGPRRRGGDRGGT